MRLVSPSALLLVAIAACQTASAQPIPGEKIGVVLMHGKWGTPGANIATVAGTLRNAGALVEMPEMPWSHNRAYAKTYDDSMKEIDAAVERLRRKGAKRILVGGLSMGANAALGYGARREGLAGIILLAPGHVPGLAGFQRRVASGVAKARKLASAGKANLRTSFVDINQRRTKNVSTTAHIYLSWFAPEGPAVWTSNAAKLKPDTPVFCADGTREPFPRCSHVAARLPNHAKSKVVRVQAGHKGVPGAARRQVLAWVRDLR